jgi:hypothetical protein
MARQKDREKAIALRLKGKSYSEIKTLLGIGKGTLSVWLREYPLSEERLIKLRDRNPIRIERFRNTMQKKRDIRQAEVYAKIAKEIGNLSKRELFLAGLFLYWAEGTKTTRYTVALTNTDPSMLRFFIAWLRLLGIDMKRVQARLHLYNDMDIASQIKFWSKEIGIPTARFHHTYVKKVLFDKRKNYKGRFGYGTCSVWITGRDIHEKVLMGIKVLADKQAILP